MVSESYGAVREPYLRRLFGKRHDEILANVPWRGRLKLDTEVVKPWTKVKESWTMSVIVDKGRDPATGDEALLVSLMVSEEPHQRIALTNRSHGTHPGAHLYPCPRVVWPFDSLYNS